MKVITMNFIKPLKIAGLLALSAPLVACAHSEVAEVSPVVKQEKPNFLYIMTDEHNFRTIGAYRDLLSKDQALMWGDTVVETPNLDFLADNGAIFTSMYATSPSCTPSRASMFTGDYPQTNSMDRNGKVLSHDVPTLADVLVEEGYRTGYVGKWHLIGNPQPMWDPEYGYGFQDKRFMFNGGHWKQFRFRGDGSPKGGKKIDGADEKSFATDWLTDRTLDFLSESDAGGAPFFHVLSIPDPHTPNTVRAPYDTMYALDDIELPATWSQRYDDTMPYWWNPEIDRATKTKDRKTGKTTRHKPRISSEELRLMVRQDVTQYFGMVKAIDDNVGRILKKLRETGQLDNTVIIFSADHGDMLGEHGRDNKGTPRESSAKVPFIVYYPDAIKPNTIINQAANNTDMMDTVLQLLGVADFDQSTTDGRDLSPWLMGKSGAGLDDITFVRFQGWAGAFTDRYKLVFDKGGSKPWLIDLEKDPNEVTNFIDDPAYRTTIQALASALKDYGLKHRDGIVRSREVAAQIDELL